MATEKYIVMLNKQDKSTLKKVEKEFSVSFFPSEELSKDNRSFNIIDEKNAVLYQNLGVMVVDNLDVDQLNASIKNEKSPIVYYEKERSFFPATELELLKELKLKAEDFSVKIAELEDFILNKSLPQKVLTGYEWGLKAIGVDHTQFSGKGINVCILDTGFDVTHPDFLGREIEGKSFVEGEDWNVDTFGHGTHCTGVAAGNLRLENGKRYGIAKDCNLKIGKVLSKNGKGTTSGIIDAIDWAIAKKFQVVSLSLASPVGINEMPSPLFESIGNKALEQNCLLIAAAGNDSKRPLLPKPVSAPANSNSFMAVAAIDSQMNIASFSNGGINAANGGNINVCAPGVGVYSSYPKKISHSTPYKMMNGTSMATPHVTGLAALYMEKFPTMSAKEIWEILENYAKPVASSKYRDIGNGLIQIL
ncbi:S8 family peptidase [Polaribacter sp. L3A8]|uniref:S8 family peptidase n=1 Tax=Polaribacter sp. L3A8 TaxID=2686361 RepID=UPI00131C0453|nr:S8 family serine peptidase [Polaribacter sp. L3A8]